MSSPSNPPGSAPAPLAGQRDDGRPAAAGRPVLDVFAVLAAMQQQLDDLREVIQAQQATLQTQQEQLHELLCIPPTRPAAHATVSSPGSR